MSAPTNLTAAGAPLPRCRATKTDGSPCGSTGNLSADSLCLWHDPARQKEAAGARARGQKAAAAPKAPAVPSTPLPGDLVTLEDADRWCTWIATQLALGALDPRVAREMTAAIAQKRHVLSSLREIERRVKDFKQRMTTLERDRQAAGS